MESLADIAFAAGQTAVRNLMPNFGDDGATRKSGAKLRDLIRGSKRYYIDEDVTRAATRLGIQHPDVLMQMLRRARAPFEKVWIEWPLRPALEEAGVPEIAEDSPERTGCIIERLSETEPLYRLTNLNMGHGGDRRVMIHPLSIVYNLNEPFVDHDRDEQLARHAKGAALTADYLSKSLLGSVYMGRTDNPEDAEERQHRTAICDRLVKHASYSSAPVMRPIMESLRLGSNQRAIEIAQEMNAVSIVEGAGTWRFVISVLALINSRDYVDTETPWRAGKSRFVGGKVMPYLEHLLVRLKLPRAIVERRVVREMAEAIPRRRHEVTGHWKQSRKHGNPDCQHVYVEETDTRERCVECNHARWWVNEFSRGSAELGFVIKDRLVTR